MNKEQKKIQDWIRALHQRIFSEAEPSVDYDTLVFVNKNIVKFPDKWYDFFYLKQARQDEIIEEEFRKTGLPKRIFKQYAPGIYLGHLPNGYKKKEREKSK